MNRILFSTLVLLGLASAQRYSDSNKYDSRYYSSYYSSNGDYYQTWDGASEPSSRDSQSRYSSNGDYYQTWDGASDYFAPGGSGYKPVDYTSDWDRPSSRYQSSWYSNYYNPSRYQSSYTDSDWNNHGTGWDSPSTYNGIVVDKPQGGIVVDTSSSSGLQGKVEQALDLLNSVEVDSELISEVVEELYETDKDFQEWTQEAMMTGYFNDAIESVQNAYKTAVGQFIISFGKTIIPVYEAELNIAEFFILNDGCDTTCAESCVDLKAVENMFFDQTCLDSCSCSFNFNNMTADEIQDAYNSYNTVGMQYLMNIAQIWGTGVQNLAPAFETAIKYNTEMMKQWAEASEFIASEYFGCDSTCASTCASNLDRYNCPSDLVMCYAQCRCTESVITMTQGGQYDYYSLLEFSGFKSKAFSYFMKVKDQY